MALNLTLALLAGILVGVSRSVNGRLSLATSPLRASLWNHVVGFALLSALIPVLGGFWTGAHPVPPVAWLGGPIGVIFVAAGSHLIARIGAVATALLMISGQMISGVLLDALRGDGGAVGLRALGIVLILAGIRATLPRGPK